MCANKQSCDCGCPTPKPASDCEHEKFRSATAGAGTGAVIGMSTAGPPGALVGAIIGWIAGENSAQKSEHCKPR